MKFFDLFPTPKFLKLAEAGVSISDKAIRFISLSPERGGHLKIDKSGEILLPEGVVSSGVVADKAALVTALSELKTKHNFDFVAATLPEEKTYLFVTPVDKGEYKDLHDAVAFTIEENAPVSLENSLFAFEMLDEPKGFKVAVSVLPTDIAETYIDAFESAGLTPISFDIESQAIARSLVAKGDNRTHLIVHIGERKVGLYLVENEVVQFSSIINADLSKSESADIVSMMKSELRKFFVFWDTRLEQDGLPGKKVDHIILSGSEAVNESLVASIMSDISIPYALGNVWQNVCSIEKHLPKMPFDVSLSYAGAIGAALGESPHAYV